MGVARRAHKMLQTALFRHQCCVFICPPTMSTYSQRIERDRTRSGERLQTRPLADRLRRAPAALSRTATSECSSSSTSSGTTPDPPSALHPSSVNHETPILTTTKHNDAAAIQIDHRDGDMEHVPRRSAIRMQPHAAATTAGSSQRSSAISASAACVSSSCRAHVST
jgi:hypothetical protein